MNRVHDWQRLLRYAWSVRLAVLAGALSAGTAIMACFLQGASVMFFVAFMFVSISASVAAFSAAGARVIAQPKMHQERPQ